MKSLNEELAFFEKQIMSYRIPRYEEFPSLELYKDQIILLLSKNFAPFVYDEEEPILTSSMINNYVKHSIIPPPNGKKYTRRHLAYITVVCFLKQVLSMNEIKEVIYNSLNTGDERTSYTYFCEQLEKAFKECCLRKGEEDMTNLSINNFAIHYSTKAVANKLYAQKIIQLQAEK